MTIPRPRSLYDVLNVAPEAEAVVIEAAYKALIKKYHPDHSDGEGIPRDAAQINKAFAILKDPAKRAEYDHRLWVREQAIRAAGLQPPPRRSSGLVGAAGWLTAILLGGVVAVMATGREAVPTAPALAAAPQRAAPAPAPAENVPSFLTSERVEADLRILRSAAAEQVALAEATAAEARERAEPTEGTDRPADAAEAPPSPPPPRLRVVERPAAAARATAPPRPRKQPRPKPPSGEDGEFLEREGYIY